MRLKSIKGIAWFSQSNSFVSASHRIASHRFQKACERRQNLGWGRRGIEGEPEGWRIAVRFARERERRKCCVVQDFFRFCVLIKLDLQLDPCSFLDENKVEEIENLFLKRPGSLGREEFRNFLCIGMFYCLWIVACVHFEKGGVRCGR